MSFSGIPASVLLDFFEAEPLHVRLPQAEPVLCNHVAVLVYVSGVGVIELVGNGDLVAFDPEGIGDSGFLTERFLQVKNSSKLLRG